MDTADLRMNKKWIQVASEAMSKPTLTSRTNNASASSMHSKPDVSRFALNAKNEKHKSGSYNCLMKLASRFIKVLRHN
jgi:hypothetical protein